MVKSSLKCIVDGCGGDLERIAYGQYVDGGACGDGYYPEYYGCTACGQDHYRVEFGSWNPSDIEKKQATLQICNKIPEDAERYKDGG